MRLLDSFQKISLNNNAPSMSVSNYGLTFNKSVLEIMGMPDYIDLFLDESEKRLAITKSDSQTGIAFCANKGNHVNARINNKEFARKLFKLMGWEYKSISYKVPGSWHDDEKVFIFDLNDFTENNMLQKDLS